jgi:RND family efflux transporter MFP subunit
MQSFCEPLEDFMTSIRFFDRRAIAAAALFLAACGNEVAHETARTVTAPVQVVETTAIPDTRITTGTVRAMTVSPLAAKVMGNVTRVLVSEGQRVHAGELLLEIDDREGRARTQQATAGGGEVDQAISGATAGVAAAEANATLANATYKRFAALRERGSVSPQEFEEVTARKQGADAQLEQARRGRDAMLARRSQARAGLSEAETFLSYSSVRSPINGVVTARMIDPGAQAAPGMPLLTVEDDSRFRVETTVDEDLAGIVHVGDAVTVDGGAQPITARVTNIVPAVDPVTRSALVKIDLPQGSGLRSGTFVRVAFKVGSRNGIMVPEAAIVRRGELTSVYVVDGDGFARMRLVALGSAVGNTVEVLSGLDAGEKIVPQLSNEIRDGVRVAARAATKTEATAVIPSCRSREAAQDSEGSPALPGLAGDSSPRFTPPGFRRLGMTGAAARGGLS